MTFEESIIRLEEILKNLEGDKVDLESALVQYEEGVRLLKNCHVILESARQKIEQKYDKEFLAFAKIVRGEQVIY